jgi:hypothetical protein
MVIDYRQGKALQERLQISGPFEGRTIGNYHPTAHALGLFRRRDKEAFIGFNFGPLEGAGGTGQGLFTHAAQYGNQGKLAPHAVSVRLFMARHKESGPALYKIHQPGRNIIPRINTIFHRFSGNPIPRRRFWRKD